ncbi:MAG: hypothetical protein JWN40_1214 [Phycisphaerales bacterium]|nr:hypothetical protein [Phycisphaerales bacterium]
MAHFHRYFKPNCARKTITPANLCALPYAMSIPQSEERLKKTSRNNPSAAGSGRQVCPPSPIAAVPPPAIAQERSKTVRRTTARKRSPAPFLPAARRGILARKVTPLRTGALEDREYEALRVELVREFEPQTISEWNAVELLALDYIRLARTALIDEPPTTTTSDRQYVGDAEEAIRIAKLLMQQANDDQPFACPIEFLELTAEDLCRHARELHRYAKTRKLAARKYGALDVEGLGATDRAVLGKLLSGGPRDPDHRERWSFLIDDWLKELEGDLVMARSEERTFRRGERVRYAPLIERVSHLARLQCYEAHLLKTIADAIAFLEARRSARER